MPDTLASVEDYIQKSREERQVVLQKLRKVITSNLPKGFEEGIQYKMIGYYVPHSLYPAGYHCNPKEPLPFLNLASQKNSVNLYHMGIYTDKNLHDWFVSEYPKHSKTKLDMGKSCIRFKKLDQIPYGLLAELFQKITPQDWIATYEKVIKK
ncbi:DUF1801 domain-containing protein [Gaetbulibacter aestuarii]|uniref:DUF1801 domain-containing protein n=1 Tax=Gaetbulibacter aestuarii TaxID=1502358 RepID=A0ABW7MXF8_9FLAO